MLDAGEEITVADVRAALQQPEHAGERHQAGRRDLLQHRLGLALDEEQRPFNSGEPGIGLDVARWVVEKDLCLTGADTWAIEVVPNPDKDLAFIVHAELNTKNGILNHENLDFDELIADRKYQFVYIFSPSPIKGATGSNGCPIAVT